MSGGGASQVTNSNPWSAAQPYLTDIMGKSQGLYGQQAPQYSNPASNFGYNPTTAAVGNSISGNTSLGSMTNQIQPIATGAIGSSFASPFGTAGGLDATSAIKKQLSGQPDYTAVNGAIGAANDQQWNQFYNNVVPQLNQRASFLGNPSGAIKDLNSSITNLTNNQSLNAQQAYLGQYNNAQQQAQQAAGLVAQGGLATQQNATSLGGLGANLAANTGAQSLQGASQFGGLAQMPQQNLADYANIVSSTGGKFGSDTTQNQPGAAGTAANIIGGLTAGSGLVSQLLGGASTATGATPGLVGQIGSMFGSGAPAVGGALGTGALGSGAAANGALADAGFGGATSVAPIAGDATAGGYAGGGALAAGAAGADAAAAGGLGAFGSGAAANAALADAGFGGAAAGGAGAAGTAAGTGAAAGGSAGAGSAATAGLGAGAGAAAAVALPLAMAYMGYSKPGVQAGAKYWSNLSSGLSQPPGSRDYQNAAMELSALMSGDQVGQIPSQIRQLATQLGIQPLAPSISRPKGGYGMYGSNVKLN